MRVGGRFIVLTAKRCVLSDITVISVVTDAMAICERGVRPLSCLTSYDHDNCALQMMKKQSCNGNL